MTSKRHSWFLPLLLVNCSANPNSDEKAAPSQGGTSSSGGSAAGTAGSNAAGSGSGGQSTNGGTSSSGGQSPGGSAGSAGSGNGGGPQKEVLPCDSLSEIGEWENITPAGVTFSQQFGLDPVHPGTVILGAGQGMGIWKTTDCGASWERLNTEGDTMDSGGHWTLVIDPIEPDVIWTANGYGIFGVFKSTNGGKDWTQMLTEDAFNTAGHVEVIAMDPTDHLHLTVTPHFECGNGHTPNCFLETKDGGTTWEVLEDQPASGEDAGQLMIDSNVWLMPGWNQILRTSDGGGTWNKVSDLGACPSLYQTTDGTYFLAGLWQGILKSSDTISWEAIPNSPHVRAISGDGISMFGSDRNPSDTPHEPYSVATLPNLSSWSKYPSTGMKAGGWTLNYDDDHGVLYSSNESAGFWRVKTK